MMLSGLGTTTDSKAAGPKLERFWTGAKAYEGPPVGTLPEWHWRALAKAYAAGDAGLEGDYGTYARVGWNTSWRMRDYKWGSVEVKVEVEERLYPQRPLQTPQVPVSRGVRNVCTSPR